MIWLSGGRLVLLIDGKPFREGWNKRKRPALWVVIKHHREHGPGSVGIRPDSVGFCHIDVDSSIEDALRLRALFPPFFSFVSRNGRGEHLGFTSPDPSMKERTRILWQGATVDLKFRGLCRTPDPALCRIASALVRRADGDPVPELPESFLEAYDEAGHKVAEELADQAADEATAQAAPQSSGASQSKAAPKRAARVARVRGRGTPISEQPAPARRIQDAVPGNRNTTFYYRGRWWAGRHASEFATYPEFAAHWEPILYEAAMRMAQPEETDARILASARSALGWAWREFGGGSVTVPGSAAAVTAPGSDPEAQAWLAGQRRRSQCGEEATARRRQAERDERYARILEIDATTSTVAETAALAGVHVRTVQRARKAAAPESDGTENTPTTARRAAGAPMPSRRLSPLGEFPYPSSGRGRGRPRGVSPKRLHEI